MNNNEWNKPTITVWEHDLEMGKLFFANERLKIAVIVESIIISGLIAYIITL